MLVDTPFDNIEKLAKAAAAQGRLGPGRNFYVAGSVAQHGARAASDTTNRGGFLDPFSTIDYAIGACTASRGDNIIVLPGHAATVTAAAGIDADVAGITILGLGDGSLTPTITFTTATTADVDIDAANITFDNINFVVAIDAAVAPIDVNAGYFTMRNCRATVADGTYQAVRFLLTDATGSVGLRLLNCTFLGQTTVGAAGDAVSIVTLTGGDNVLIEGCRIEGRCTTTIGPIENLTTATTNLVVRKCELANWTTSSTTCIDTVAATTLKVVDCDFIITDNATLAPVDTTGVVQLSGRNYVTNTTDETGALVGTVSA